MKIEIDLTAKDVLKTVGSMFIGGAVGFAISSGICYMIDKYTDDAIRDRTCTQQLLVLNKMVILDKSVDKSKYDYYKNELVWKSSAGVVSKCFQKQK